jgi:hypothetical protein
MDRQYKPLYLTIEDFPVIVYIAKDESPVTEVLPTQADVRAYVERLFIENANIKTGDYAIVFVWNDHGKEMADVWMLGDNTHSNSGPLYECFAFAGSEQSMSGDIASGDTIITLAAEEQKHRQIGDRRRYLADTSTAVFPEGMAPKEDYPA